MEAINLTPCARKRAEAERLLKQQNNINEREYISLLNEFEKTCAPLLALKSASINAAINNFSNAVRAFGMDSSLSSLNKLIAVFEQLEAMFAEIIIITHTQYGDDARRNVSYTAPAIFHAINMGIRILRLFYKFCRTYGIVDKEVADVFLELTENSKCSTMGVYVENAFFESMNEICRSLDAKKQDNNMCSTTVKYRSAKERLDNISPNRDISEKLIDVRNFLDTWNMFLSVVAKFIIQNYVRLRDKKVSLCFQTFLDQQYQIVLEYYSQYSAYVKRQAILSSKENSGYIWK